MQYSIIQPIIIAVALGFMIGMQRTMRAPGTTHEHIAGSRTFALIALMGYISGWLGSAIDGLVPVVAAVMGLLISLSYALRAIRLHKMGMTTQATALITFFLGLMLFMKAQEYAIFISVLVVVILEIKPRLKAFESHLSSTDIDAAVLLLAMSFLILPILPDAMVGPYALFNPYKTWLMAIIIAAISFVGYAAVKLLGQRFGVLIAGAAGGLVSSTAVTISLSKRYNRQQDLIDSYGSSIAIASTIMLTRVLIVTAIFNIDLTRALAPAYLAATLIGILYSYLLYRRSVHRDTAPQSTDPVTNPLQLSEAIKFALLFGIVYGALTLTRTHFGVTGIYLLSLLTGITDVDAITLSLSELTSKELLTLTPAMFGIVIASVANSGFKLSIVFWRGGASLGWKMMQFYLLTLGTLGAVLSLTL